MTSRRSEKINSERYDDEYGADSKRAKKAKKKKGKKEYRGGSDHPGFC